MLVSELIEQLKELPQDAPMGIFYDGANMAKLETVWLSKGGDVVVGPMDYPVYLDEDRVAGAPLESDNRYLAIWEMLGLPEPKSDDDD